MNREFEKTGRSHISSSRANNKSLPRAYRQ